jgi:indole-3-glycerol phosphate synthase
MSDVLQRICADKRRHVAARRAERPLADVEAAARDASPVRGFADRLRARVAAGEIGLIAEIKKASPSKGLIRADFDPPALARAYQAGGATCLSVLTDEPYFQGRDDYLSTARDAVGADCILLIMAALEDGQAAELEAAAGEWGMDVLIEVHDAAERDRALRLKSRLIGVNNRNLKTLHVDLATSEELSDGLPADALAVSESGLYTPDDLARMRRAGFHCFLVGESLMRQPDVAAATAALLGRPLAAAGA